MTDPHPTDPDRFYSAEQRALQDATDRRAIADRLATTIVHREVPPEHADFITSRDFFLLATVDADGRPTVSYKGGPPGVVQVPDPSTLLLPDYDGNGMYLSLGNIRATASIGLLFLDLETPHRVRVQATATVLADDPDLDRFPGARHLVRADVEAVFVNCGRYVHRYRRLAPSRFVPGPDGRQPHPAWKRIEGFQDALPADDRHRTTAEGGPITHDAYRARVRAGDP